MKKEKLMFFYGWFLSAFSLSFWIQEINCYASSNSGGLGITILATFVVSTTLLIVLKVLSGVLYVVFLALCSVKQRFWPGFNIKFYQDASGFIRSDDTRGQLQLVLYGLNGYKGLPVEKTWGDFKAKVLSVDPRFTLKLTLKNGDVI